MNQNLLTFFSTQTNNRGQQQQWLYLVEGWRIGDLLDICEIDSNKAVGNQMKPNTVQNNWPNQEIDVWMWVISGKRFFQIKNLKDSYGSVVVTNVKSDR